MSLNEKVLQAIENSTKAFDKIPYAPPDFFTFLSKDINRADYLERTNFLYRIDKIKFDLNVKLPHLLNEYIRVLKHDKKLIYSLIGLGNQRIRPNKQKVFISFIISIIENFPGIERNNIFFDIFDTSPNERWNCFFCGDKYFPNDPTNEWEKELILHLNYFFYLSIINDEKMNNFKSLLDHINDFIQYNEKALYNFLPLLLYIYKDDRQNLISPFIDSRLFINFLRIAENEKPIFDYIIHIMCDYPLLLFHNPFLFTHFSIYFQNLSLNKYIFFVIEKVFLILKQDPCLFSNMCSVILHLYQESNNEKIIGSIFSFIDQFYNVIPPNISSSLFNIIANFYIPNNGYDLVINTTQKILSNNNSFLRHLEKNHKFFDALSAYEGDFELNHLIKFATYEDHSFPNKSFIFNFRGMKILFDLLPHHSKLEDDVISFLVEMVSIDKSDIYMASGNLIELEKAGIFQLIFNRLPIIQNKDEIRNKYIELFSIISSYTFNQKDFYHLIRLLLSQELKTEYKNNFIQNINQQLGKTYYFPKIFLRFYYENGSGIFCPNVNLTKFYSIFFLIRFNLLKSLEKSLIFFYIEENKYVDIRINKNGIYIYENDNLMHSFEFSFRLGKWYYFTIKSQKLFLTNKLSLLIDDNEIFTINLRNNIFQKCSIFFCARYLENNLISLICDISSIYIINNIIKSDLFDKNSLFENTQFQLNSKNDNIILSINPSNIYPYQKYIPTLKEIICNKNQASSFEENQKIDFFYFGEIHFFNNISKVLNCYDNFCMFLFLLNIDNFNSIQNDEDLQAKSSFLHNILIFISKFVDKFEDVFIEKDFFYIFFSFFKEINKSIINLDVVKEIIHISKIAKSEYHKMTMTNLIFMNYELITTFEPSIIFELQENVPNIQFDDISLIFYSTITFFKEKSKVSELAWNNIKKLSRPTNYNLNFIFSFLINKTTESPCVFDKSMKFLYKKLLQILFNLISKNNIHCLELYGANFGYLNYLIIMFSFESKKIQILTLSFICYIFNITSIDTTNSLTIIYKIILIFKKPNDCEPILEECYSLIKADKIFSLIPLFSYMLKYCSFLNQNIIIKLSKPSEIDNIKFFLNNANINNILWLFWIINLFSVICYPNINAFSQIISEIDCKIDELFNLLDFLSESPTEEEKMNFNLAKAKILLNKIHKDKLFITTNFTFVFNFLLFPISIKKSGNKIKNPPIIPKLPNFELFSEFTIIPDKTQNNHPYNDHCDIAYLFIKQTLHNQSKQSMQIIGKDTNINIIEACVIVLQHFIPTNTNRYNELSVLINNSLNLKDQQQMKLCELRTCFYDLKQKELEDFQDKFIFTYITMSGLHSNDNSDLQMTYFDPNFFSNFRFLNEIFNQYNTFYHIQQRFYQNSISLYKHKILYAPCVNKVDYTKCKFKLLNKVSKNGMRHFMKINYHFNDHKIESINRDNTKGGEKIPKPEPENAFFPINISEFENNPKFQVLYVTLSHNFNSIIYIYDQKLIFFVYEAITKDSDTIKKYKNNIENFAPLIRKKKCLNYSDIRLIIDRNFANKPTACEIFMKNGKSYFFKFDDGMRDSFYKALNDLNFAKSDKDSLNNSKNFSFSLSRKNYDKKIIQKDSISSLLKTHQEQWINRAITTFEYLYYLNIFSGRSYNDLKQYLIYPFLIKNRNCEVLDINDDSIYRNYSLTTEGQKEKNQVNYLKNIEYEGYGSHKLPSSEFVVCWYQIRIEPFTSIHTDIQSQNNCPSFDIPDRLFDSIPALIQNMDSACKELIPEFFCNFSILLNENGFDLGMKSNNQIVNNVILPQWCQIENTQRNTSYTKYSSYHIFMSTMRLMLEGKFSDLHINNWFNLFFGPYRCSPHHFTVYQDFYYPENPHDDSTESEIRHCGCIPNALFESEHPERKVAEKHIITYTYEQSLKEIGDIIFKANSFILSKKSVLFQFNEDLTKLEIPLFLTEKISMLAEESQFISENYPNNFQSEFIFLYIDSNPKLIIFGTTQFPYLSVCNLNNNFDLSAEFPCSSKINVAVNVRNEYLITGESDCFLKTWKLSNFQCIAESCFHSFPIIAVGSNYQSELIISYDSNGYFVFQTLYDHTFITGFHINEIFQNEHFQVPNIAVFKSGTVCISQQNEIALLNSYGRIIAKFYFEDSFFSMHKYYDIDTHEFLIVGTNPNRILIYDISLLYKIVEYESYFDWIAPIQKKRTFILHYKKQFKFFNFSKFISLKVSKNKAEKYVSC